MACTKSNSFHYKKNCKQKPIEVSLVLNLDQSYPSREDIADDNRGDRQSDGKEVEGLLVKELIKGWKVVVHIVVDLRVNAKVIASQLTNHYSS